MNKGSGERPTTERPEFAHATQVEARAHGLPRPALAPGLEWAFAHCWRIGSYTTLCGVDHSAVSAFTQPTCEECKRLAAALSAPKSERSISVRVEIDTSALKTACLALDPERRARHVELAYSLCRAIEALPASEQQTAISITASELHRLLSEVA